MENNIYTTIPEYINLFEVEIQSILIELYKLIKSLVPEAEETISYKMPTFRYNGNLIHFAMFKKHLGIYPGNEAIEFHKTELKGYKTTKSAIQIPIEKPLPVDLIKNIIAFKLKLISDKKPSDWKKYNSKYPELNEALEQLLAKTELIKETKWGTNVYTYKGKNVLAFSGFKNHFSLWFYNGVFLSDKDNVLINANESKTKALRQWRLKSIADFDEKKVMNYIKEAIQIAKSGKVIPKNKTENKPIVGLLKEMLDQDLELKNKFESLSKSCQREYIDYIEEAKKVQTKINRLEKIKPMILEKKGLNDKYKK